MILTNIKKKKKEKHFEEIPIKRLTDKFFIDEIAIADHEQQHNNTNLLYICVIHFISASSMCMVYAMRYAIDMRFWV